MKYLKKFNENSHDWASNAMPGASDEEVVRARERFRDSDLHAKIQEHPGYHHARTAYPHASDEEIAAMIGLHADEPEKSSGYKPEEPEEECEPCGDGEEGAEVYEEEPGAEAEEERPTFGSRIKNFLGFGK